MGKPNLGLMAKAGTVGSGLIAADAVVGSHIAASAIVGSHIGANIIVGSHITAAGIVSSHIAANAVLGSHITAAGVVGSHIGAGVIVASHLGAGVGGESHTRDLAVGTINGTNQVFTATGLTAPNPWAIYPILDMMWPRRVAAASDNTGADTYFMASSDATIFTIGEAPVAGGSVEFVAFE